MKKLRLLVLPLTISLLAGCNLFNGKSENNFVLDFDNGQTLNKENVKGILGDFELISPEDNFIVGSEPTFTWSASNNALHYTLEVCSSDTFDYTSSSIVYTKETNIAATSFKLSASLKQKNITYYWRVTAVNEYNTKAMGKTKMSEVRSFFYKVESVGEIAIPVGEAGDWALHKVGSPADISIDHNDFFGTGDQDSLVISFEKEHTSQGAITSIGWVDVQKAVEQDFFGTDAFYCNFYYMGHDSTILIRIIDQDGELWYKQVKFTQDAKQVALLKFEDFTLRTRDTIVQNEIFNYEHIQAIEVCFEKTFGDGCCIISGMKAVNYADYENMFIQNLNFNIMPTDEWINESYNFAKTISEDGSELKLEYSTTPGFNGNEKGIGSYGYGFAKIPLNRYFGSGNAVKVKVKYTGYSSNVNAIIRIYEPDRDRWSYIQPYSTLVEGEYSQLTIPFMAFDQSSISEGKRQFYYIENLQFGCEHLYGNGAIYYKDFQIVELPSVKENPKVIGNDGIIENFDNYTLRTEMYEKWETSLDNKDEGMFLSKDDKFATADNVYAGKFTYKTDMSMATYDVYTDVQVSGLNALKFWIKDASIPNTTEPRFNDYTGEDVAPLVALQIALKDGRLYRYIIDKAPRRWTEYVVPFRDFDLYEGIELETSDPLESQNVINFAFGMQYFYMFEGKGFPLYTQNNPVFMDNIMFTSASETKIEALEQELHPDENEVTLVDNMEYEDQASLENHWFGLNKLDYERITLSDDVSNQGGTHSMELNYKGATSPSYATYPTVGSDVNCKAIQLDIKGDGIASIYINFYIRAGSSTTYHQYRHTISNPSTEWTRYTIGFGTSNWQALTSGAPNLKSSSMQSLQRLTFGIVNSDGTESSIYVDNICFINKDVSASTNSVLPIM